MQHRCGKWRPAFALFAAIALSPPILADDIKPISPLSGCGSPDARMLALPVRAMTPSLQALDTLQPNNFALIADKVPIDICSLTHDRQPVSVGIVLDISGSMRGGRTNLPAIARAAIGKLLDTSEPGDEYFLEFVNDGPSMWCSFGCDIRHIRDGLHPRLKGKTALIDGLYMALHEMSKAHHANRALFVVSDGLDNGSAHEFSELERAYADALVPIFLLVPAERFGPDWNRRVLETQVSDRLDRLVRQSGGYGVVAFDEKEALAGMTQLASAIRSPYILYFASPLQPFTRLRVELNGVRPKPRLFYSGKGGGL